MTPDDFKERMTELSKGEDIEDRHVYMDNLMCDLLRELGYGDGVDIFELTGKWYA